MLFWFEFVYVERCVVWTGDGRVFFYNPSQRASLWEKPEELIGRTDVDKMIQGPPDNNKGTHYLLFLQILQLVKVYNAVDLIIFCLFRSSERRGGAPCQEVQVSGLHYPHNDLIVQVYSKQSIFCRVIYILWR